MVALNIFSGNWGGVKTGKGDSNEKFEYTYTTSEDSALKMDLV